MDLHDEMSENIPEQKSISVYRLKILIILLFASSELLAKHKITIEYKTNSNKTLQYKYTALHCHCLFY